MSPGNLLEVQSLGSYPRTMEPGILSWGWSALTRSPGDADACSSLRTVASTFIIRHFLHTELPCFSLSYIGSPCTYYAPTQQSPLVLRWPTDVHKMAGNMVNRLPPEDPQRLFPVNMKKSHRIKVMANCSPFRNGCGDEIPQQEAALGKGERQHPDTQEQHAWTLGGGLEGMGQSSS